MKEMTFILVIIGIFFAELNLNLFSEFGFLIYAILVGVILILMENEVVMTKYEKIFLFSCRAASSFRLKCNTLLPGQKTIIHIFHTT